MEFICRVTQPHRLTFRKRYPHNRWLKPCVVESPPLTLRPGQLDVPLEERLELDPLNGLVIGLFLLLDATETAAAETRCSRCTYAIKAVTAAAAAAATAGTRCSRCTYESKDVHFTTVKNVRICSRCTALDGRWTACGDNLPPAYAVCVEPPQQESTEAPFTCKETTPSPNNLAKTESSHHQNRPHTTNDPPPSSTIPLTGRCLARSTSRDAAGGRLSAP